MCWVSGARCEAVRSCTEICLRAPPDGIPHRFKVNRTNPATQVDTGTHECLIGLLSEPGGDIHLPLLEFKYSF